MPAKVELATVSVPETIPQLLENQNPCAIDDKDLRRERKRCRHCPAFSGADVALEARCGAEMRRIRMDILDKDLFDPRALTPQYTSWTMRLLNRLDTALGSTIMDKPAFSLAPASGSTENQLAKGPSDFVDKAKRGDFDSLFERGAVKVSDILISAQSPPPDPPTVELIASSPFKPARFVPPKYPALARSAGVSGKVTVAVAVDENGKVAAAKMLAGHPLLKTAAIEGATEWRFPPEAAGQQIEVTIEFRFNCVSNRN